MKLELGSKNWIDIHIKSDMEGQRVLLEGKQRLLKNGVVCHKSVEIWHVISDGGQQTPVES